MDELQNFLRRSEDESRLVNLLMQRQKELVDEERVLLHGIVKSATDTKRYVYAVAIVSLYGLLEQLVDALILRFVDRVASAAESYEKMPDTLKKNHVPMSMDLLKTILEEKHPTKTTQEEVITNLHSCLSSTGGFRVNGEAFVLHRGNITLSRITKALTSVGIHGHVVRVMSAPPLIAFLKRREPERDFQRVADQDFEAMLQPIDDLVERRNQISHGVLSVDDIESTDLLNERCDFIAAYGRALLEVVLQETLKNEIANNVGQILGRPLKTFGDSIVCFESKRCQIAVGDILVARTGETKIPIRYSQIISLQIDHEPFDVVSTIDALIAFGAKIHFKPNPAHEFFVLPASSV